MGGVAGRARLEQLEDRRGGGATHDRDRLGLAPARTFVGRHRPPWLRELDERLASGFVGGRQRWADQLREVAEPEPWPEPDYAPVLRAAGFELRFPDFRPGRVNAVEVARRVAEEVRELGGDHVDPPDGSGFRRRP